MFKINSNLFYLPSVRHVNKKLLTTKFVLLKNQLVEKKLIVFIALILLLGLYQRIHIQTINCVEVLVCVQKNFFIGCSFFSLHMYVYIYICVQSLLFLSSQQCPRRRKEEKKKESEDIERSIGRTTELPSDTTSKSEKKRGETEEMRRSNCCLLLIWIYIYIYI